MASWSAGAHIFEEIAEVLRANVTDYADRVDIYKELIPIFENYGAHLESAYGSVDEAFDDAFSEEDDEDEEELE